MTKPIISVILGSYNRLPFLKLTIESVRKELINIEYETIIIDGGSNDGTLNWLQNQRDIITIIQYNRGTWNSKKIITKSWGYFMNLGFKCAHGKYICMLSDDCLIVPNAITNSIQLFEKKLEEKEKIGAIAFYWRDWPVDNKYHIGIPLENKIYVNHGLYLKRALEEVNYIDEETFVFYAADIDLCLKMSQKNYNVIASENSYIEHYPHANLKVRKLNAKNDLPDLKKLKIKWEKIFPEINYYDLATIKEKDYDDPFLTAQKFQQLHLQIQKNNVLFF
ncbi:MAG: glycosyltransferase [bacterium]